ncbi:thioredoxin family protein [Mesonia aestuariivivens]|uniref:Thioredoxin family protein n=1 Tax=Mesonia aestuariivivens TaxID=2796128 RepID=A0ABS6W268_9FLAO|nr:thioredoxin family protein [Mesonia aestuariivivens]MBW2961819.1 thioredoxin family protein [Mesonia aestuariivivens]
MARTYSIDIDLGTKAPEFELRDSVTNNLVKLYDVKGEKGTVVMFICNHCPFVKHVNDEIVRLANDYRVLGFGFVAISSNDVKNYPEDHPKLMHENARKHNFTFPYLYDETQEVAKAYQAACTPDFYVFDTDLKLVYHGQLDDSRPQNGIPVTGRSIREALDAILNNRKVPQLQKPSLGCGIKWKQEN